MWVVDFSLAPCLDGMSAIFSAATLAFRISKGKWSVDTITLIGGFTLSLMIFIIIFHGDGGEYFHVIHDFLNIHIRIVEKVYKFSNRVWGV